MGVNVRKVRIAHTSPVTSVFYRLNCWKTDPCTFHIHPSQLTTKRIKFKWNGIEVAACLINVKWKSTHRGYKNHYWIWLWVKRKRRRKNRKNFTLRIPFTDMHWVLQWMYSSSIEGSSIQICENGEVLIWIQCFVLWFFYFSFLFGFTWVVHTILPHIFILLSALLLLLFLIL